MPQGRLTGRVRYRSTFLGRLVLQVEEQYRTAGFGRPQPGRTYLHRHYRDASVEDLLFFSLSSLLPEGTDTYRQADEDD